MTYYESELACERCIYALAMASVCAKGIKENALLNKLHINPLSQFYLGLKEISGKCCTLRQKCS